MEKYADTRTTILLNTTKMKLKDLKTKRGWKRILPTGYLSQGIYSALGDNTGTPIDNLSFLNISQADFLREFYPSGHAINDPKIYPDIFKVEYVNVKDPETGLETGAVEQRYYKESLPRYAFSFQQIITLKQIVHLCGNDIQFELNVENPTPEQTTDFLEFRSGWIGKDMELAFYEAVKSTKIVGDSAIVGFIDKGEFRYKMLSYMNGDTLYPHINSLTGKMDIFVRSYYDYDEDGKKIIEWLEVWDKEWLSRYKKTQEQTVVDKIKEMFGVEGYSLISRKAHGFKDIPVAYKRDDDGACWTPSQDSIEGYELCFSQMSHSNKAFGHPILTLAGEGDFGKEFDLNGSVKVLTMGRDDKAGYLQSTNASESFMKELDTLYKMIYEQSFTVIPPELKSGDLPAAALKILYSPAYEKAVTDANDYQEFLNDLIKLFQYGYGLEMEKTINYATLPMKWWIKPYVHVSESAMIQDLATSVQTGFLSRQTASERASYYTTVSEWDRIKTEQNEKRKADMEMEVEKAKISHPVNPNAMGEPDQTNV